MEQNLVVYSDGEIELEIAIEEESIWLLTEDIATIFGVQRPAVVKHIGNIYKDDELLQNSTCSILEQVTKDGKKRKVNYYNLDMIISVGYRVNSTKATKFRQWATSVLKSYITNSFVINSDKITHERFKELECDVNNLKSKVAKIDRLVDTNTYIATQGIFYNGQIFDAYVFINDLLKEAKSKVLLIDNYIDDSLFTICSKYPNISFTIYTHAISKQLNLDYIKYQKQYNNIELRINKNFHDRFIVLDNQTIYHIGASLKDLGKKVFAFSKMELSLEVFKKL